MILNTAFAAESWPEPHHTAFLIRRYPKSLGESSLLGQFIEREITVRNGVLPDGQFSDEAFLTATKLLQSELVKVEVNYKDFNVQVRFKDLTYIMVYGIFNPNYEQTIRELPAYSATDLVADFGGNLGLWVGWSSEFSCSNALSRLCVSSDEPHGAEITQPPRNRNNIRRYPSPFHRLFCLSFLLYIYMYVGFISHGIPSIF